MRTAEPSGQQTEVALAVKGRFAGYACAFTATVGGENGIAVSGRIDVENEPLGMFLRKVLSLRPEDIAIFPDLPLPSPSFTYRARPETLLIRLVTEITLPAGAPVVKLDLDFAFGRLAGDGGSRYVVGLRAFTRQPIRIATTLGSDGGSELIDKLLGDFGISHLGLYYASETIADSLALFDGEEKGRVFAKGISFSARFGTSGSYTDIALPPPPGASGDGTEATPASGGTPAPSLQPVTGDDARLRKWFEVQKTFGPLEVRRIGGEWHEGKLGFLLDAGVELLGLKVALAGLRVSIAPANLTKLKVEDLEFGLDGLEIGFTGGPISISGAFLKSPDGAYSGMALIRAPMLTIAAIGSYATTKSGDPSLYIFGAYVGVIGGPPCFVVQGIAAGFGYNRGLTVPQIEEVHNFPLVSLVRSPPPGGSASMLPQLGGNHFPVAQGQYWLAAGIKFTSFKLIDAFALLTVQFGARFELALLGVASMQQPPKLADSAALPKPFVYVELALSVRFAPDNGLFAARAALTSNSYLFDTRCKLTGGFAFCIWFPPANPAFKDQDHSGDFVLTFGGYHPRFTVPRHYPQVPRIGFNWQLPDQGVTIKGECYFALTPSCIMGGCRLLATYRSSVLAVWFEAHADFLMAWEPFHYEAEIGIWIGASFTLRVGEITTTFSFQLGASLSIWGPEFAGEAHIDLGIASFTVPIGAANTPRTPDPLTWDEFCGKFIPRIDNQPAPLGIAVTGGLLREDKNQGVTIVNPCELSLLVDAYIPVSELAIDGKPLSQDAEEPAPATQFGIRPMDERAIASKLEVRFLGPDGNPVVMRTRAVTKGLPEALWSREPAPSALDTLPIEVKVIMNALSGVRLSVGEMRQPKQAAASPKVDAIAKRTAQPGLEKPRHALPVDADAARRRLSTMLIANTEARTQAVTALAVLGFDLSPDTINIAEMARCALQADVLLAPPAFVALGELPPQRQDQ